MTQKEIKDQNTQLIIDECLKQGVTDKNQIKYILATAEWETNHTFQPVREAYWVSDAWRQKHLRYYPYYGRGFVQLTWKKNYEKFSKLLNVDLVNNPDLLLNAKLSAFVIVYGMKHGTFTGKKLQDYINDNGVDFVNAREIINGSNEEYKIASIAEKEPRIV